MPMTQEGHAAGSTQANPVMLTERHARRKTGAVFINENAIGAVNANGVYPTQSTSDTQDR
jgi:hypothetical protein